MKRVRNKELQGRIWSKFQIPPLKPVTISIFIHAAWNRILKNLVTPSWPNLKVILTTQNCSLHVNWIFFVPGVFMETSPHPENVKEADRFACKICSLAICHPEADQEICSTVRPDYWCHICYFFSLEFKIRERGSTNTEIAQGTKWIIWRWEATVLISLSWRCCVQTDAQNGGQGLVAHFFWHFRQSSWCSGGKRETYPHGSPYLYF